jgi:hypothetical protein
MGSLFLATRAIFHLFHFIGVASLVAGRDIVLLTTDRALEDDVIALGFGHKISHFFLFAVVIVA